jgi:hypothetical protein
MTDWADTIGGPVSAAAQAQLPFDEAAVKYR